MQAATSRCTQDGAGRGSATGARQVSVLLFYCGLATILTYPLVAIFDRGVLGPPGDNLEYLYKLWWFKQALFDLRVSPFFNPNVFYPHGYSLALHEMSLANVSIGMPLTIWFGETVAYNALLVLSFVLSAFGAYLLALRWTGRRLAALLSGVLFAFCSYRMAHLAGGHLNLLGTQWLPFLFLELDQLAARPLLRSGILAGVFFALMALSSWYYAPMVAIFAAVYLLWRTRPWRVAWARRRLLLSVVVASAVAGVLMLPGLLPTLRQRNQREMVFSLREVDMFSASVEDLVMPSVAHPLWGRRVVTFYAERLDVLELIVSLSWTGIVLSALALWRRRKHGITVFALLLALSAVLALGTTLHVGGQRLSVAVPEGVERLFTAGMGLLAKRLALNAQPSYYELRLPGAIYLPLPTLLLYLFVPLFDAMRVWARFGMISAFAVAILAASGLSRLLRALEGNAQWSRWRLALAGLCLGVAVFELWAVPHPFGWTEVRKQPLDEWLAGQRGRGAVVQLPLWRSERGPALYASTVHGKPIAYGYGAFFPNDYRQERPLLYDFPTEQGLALLREWGVKWVVLRAESFGAQWPEVQRRVDQVNALRLATTLEDVGTYHSGWLAEALIDLRYGFVLDHIYVYELDG